MAAARVSPHGGPRDTAGAPGHPRGRRGDPGPGRGGAGGGAYAARDDEWVEVVNAGPSPLDLGVYFITDADSVPRYAFAGTLGAGARRVVFGREAYDWERATGRRRVAPRPRLRAVAAGAQRLRFHACGWIDLGEAQGALSVTWSGAPSRGCGPPLSRGGAR